MHNIEKQERPNFSFVLPAISREPHCLFPARFLLPWIINESTSAYEFFFRKTVHAVRIENIVEGAMGIKGNGVLIIRLTVEC